MLSEFGAISLVFEICCVTPRFYLVLVYLIPWKFPQDTGILGILLDPRWSR